MDNLFIFFGCGDVRIRGDGVDFLSRKFSDNYNIILPFYAYEVHEVRTGCLLRCRKKKFFFTR